MRLSLWLLLSVFLAASAAADRRRIAVLDFVGQDATKIRGEVLRVAATRSWVVSESTLEGKTLTDFAVEHDVDMIVQGIVEKRGRGHSTRLRFVEAVTGRLVGSVTTKTRKPALDRSTAQRIDRELVRALSKLHPRPPDW
jgi:hypothetical protein